MELDAEDRMLAMAQRHDEMIVAAFGGDLERGRERRAVDHQRVVARGHEGIGEAGEQAAPVVVDHGGLAVHQARRADHVAAEHLADRLMAQTDAEQRRLSFGRRADKVHADAGLVRGARTRGQDDSVGFQSHRLFDRDLVVTLDDTMRPKIAQKVDEVVGERVVVVDDEDHAESPCRRIR